MPVYNGAKFIGSAIESILKQSFCDFELIISDNASTDATEMICRQFAAEDPRVLYVRQAENRGPTENFRFVLSAARAPYFLWAAADDKFRPTFVERVLGVMTENPDIVLTMSDVVNVSTHDEFLYFTRLDNIRLEANARPWASKRPIFFENPTSSVFFCIYGMFRTEVARKIDINYKGKVRFATGSEVPILAQVALLGRIVSIPEELKIYRRHEGSMYHQEIISFDVVKTIRNKLNISYCLVLIAKESDVLATERLGLLLRIGSTLLTWLPLFLGKSIARWGYRALFRRR